MYLKVLPLWVPGVVICDTFVFLILMVANTMSKISIEGEHGTRIDPWVQCFLVTQKSLLKKFTAVSVQEL